MCLSFIKTLFVFIKKLEECINLVFITRRDKKNARENNTHNQ